jgi:hypothetical protein
LASVTSQVLSTEQKRVLEKRGGAVLSRRSILKTAAPRPADLEANALRVTGIADVRYDKIACPKRASARIGHVERPVLQMS